MLDEGCIYWHDETFKVGTACFLESDTFKFKTTQTEIKTKVNQTLFLCEY